MTSVLALGHTNLILCCSGQKTFQARSVGGLYNDNDSHVISGCHLCVAEDRTHVLVSSAKVFISSVKCVRIQHQKCLSQNAFVASDLIASNECIHLQCDIVCGIVF